MVTKLPEIAVILGVIVLGLQLSRSANRSLGYSLVGLGAITGIWWIYNHYRKKVRVPRRVGKLRVELTWATAAVVITFAILPLLPKAHEAEQAAAIPAQKMETSIASNASSQLANPPTRPSQAAKSTSAASPVQSPASGEAQTIAGADNNQASNVPHPSLVIKGTTIVKATDSSGSTPTGSNQLPVTLTYSQNGNTVTVKSSGPINSTSLVFFFDVDVSLPSQPVDSCARCGYGRLKDSNDVPDNKTLWVFRASPPLVPGELLSVTFSSATPAKLLRVSSGPPPPA